MNLTLDFTGPEPGRCGPKCRQQIDKWLDWLVTSPNLGGYELKDGYLVVTSPLALIPTVDPEAYRKSCHRKARGAAVHARKHGFIFAPFDRNSFLDDIHAINTSKEERGGQPMTEAYRERPAPWPGFSHADYCPRHDVVHFGAFYSPTLLAYAVAHFMNDLCILNTLLGHGDYLPSGMMNGLFEFMVAYIAQHHPATKWLNYLTLVSGRKGLRDFKRHAGFQSYSVRVKYDRAIPA